MRASACACACRVRVLLAVTAVSAVAVAAAPDGPSTAAWLRPQPQQTLMEVVTSIEQKLHNFDSSRLESNLKTIEVRLDSLEASFRRLDTAFQDRLDKLERSLNAKELKDELTVEKLTHKVRDILDTSYDRFTRRLGYTEERIDMSIKKFQMNVDGGLNRLEKLQEDIQTEVVEAVTILEDLKAHSTTSEDRLNSTHKAIQNHIQSVISPSQEQLQRISGSLEHLGSRLNTSGLGWTSQSQSDSMPPTDLLATVRTQINSEANRFTNKVNNMYNDLWRRIGTVEALVREAGRTGNSTHRELMDELRSLSQSERRDFPGDSQENFLEVAMDALDRKVQRRLNELGRRLDERLGAMSATQSLIVDSCFDDGICHGLEQRLSTVLEKIFDVYANKIEAFSNSTIDLDSLVVEMMEMEKTQHSQLIRTVTHNTNMVVRLSKDVSQANKEVISSVETISNKTGIGLQEIQYKIQEISSKPCKNIEKMETENAEEDTPKTDAPEVTELKVIIINATTPSVNTTSKLNGPEVLRITTEVDEVMADNSSVSQPTEPTKTPPKPTVLQIIGMISPNLTQDQLESFLYYLNSTVNFDSLEAIIQNTEAETSEEEEELYIDELDNMDNFNSTSSQMEFLQFINETSTQPPNTNGNITDDVFQLMTPNKTLNKGGNSSEILDDLYTTTKNLPTKGEETSKAEIVYEEIDGDVAPNELIDFDSPIKSGNLPAVAASRNDTAVKKVPEELKDQAKVLAFLMKIKNSNITVDDLWRPGNKSEHTTMNAFRPILQKLCYGDKNNTERITEDISNVMADRLLTIRQTLNDEIWYEKVESVCVKFTEFFLYKTQMTTPHTE